VLFVIDCVAGTDEALFDEFDEVEVSYGGICGSGDREVGVSELVEGNELAARV